MMSMKAVARMAVPMALCGCAAAFAPAGWGLRLKGAVPRALAPVPRSPRRSEQKRVLMQLSNLGGNTDKAAETSVDDFKKDGKSLTLLEKEQLYLECCASWNVEQKALLTDDEFETLKEDLEFEGSQVILMNREEIKFMVASARYNKGTPIMADDDFELLRAKLRAAGSLAVKHEAVSCKITEDGSRVCKADLFTDDGKQALLYSPALVLSALLFNEYAFWFNGWDPLGSLILGSPLIVAATYILTNFIYFQKPLITRTACPECNTPQNVFFGDVLFVDGGKPSHIVETKCVNKECGVKLQGNRDTMLVDVIFD